MSILTDNYELNNGIKIPKVGFGTWQIPGGQDTYDAVSMALKAVTDTLILLKLIEMKRALVKPFWILTLTEKTSSSHPNCQLLLNRTMAQLPISVLQ